MTAKALPSLSVKLRVPFYHVDPMQVVWHGSYFKYFEAARDALFESLNINLETFYLTHGYFFPIIRCSVKFIHSLRYKDVFMCTAKVVEARRKIVVEYEIKLESTNTLCTTGNTEQVVLKMPEAEIEYEVPMEIMKAIGHCS